MRISDWSSDVCSSDLRADGGNESAPEAVVDVLGGVDAKAIDMERGDPLLVDVDHPGEDTRVFGKQVIEPGKIAIQTAFALERRVAAIVVIDRIVEPCRHFDAGFLGRHERGVGITGVTQPGEVLRSLLRWRIAGKAGVYRLAVDAAAGGVRVLRK